MALPQSHGKGADAPVSPQDIWDALRAQGATPIQAAAIMGNQIAESSLNPEASVIDSNGARSVGLNQWNADSYPSSGSLVTGHPLADMLAQVKFLASTGGFAAAKGSTASPSPWSSDS